MRVRDLRSQLMKLGMGHDEVMKMLDKTELEATLARLTEHKSRMETYNKIESYWYETLKWGLNICYENPGTAVLGVIIFLCVFVIPRDYVVGILMMCQDYFMGYVYPIKSKVKALKKAWKYKLAFAVCCMLLAMVIEIYEMAIHLTFPLGWVLPHTSILRQWFPPTLYIPLSINMIKKDLPSYGMNIGPQITIMACRYVRGKVENRGAEDVMEYRDRRRNNDM